MVKTLPLHPLLDRAHSLISNLTPARVPTARLGDKVHTVQATVKILATVLLAHRRRACPRRRNRLPYNKVTAIPRLRRNTHTLAAHRRLHPAPPFRMYSRLARHLLQPLKAGIKRMVVPIVRHKPNRSTLPTTQTLRKLQARGTSRRRITEVRQDMANMAIMTYERFLIPMFVEGILCVEIG
jgi:hypothetical protein